MAIQVTPFDPNSVSYAGAGLGVAVLKKFKVLERLTLLQFEMASTGIFGFEGATIEGNPTINTVAIALLPGNVKAMGFGLMLARDQTGPILSGSPQIGLEWHPVEGDPVTLVSLTTITGDISQGLNAVDLAGPGAFVVKLSGFTGDSFTGVAVVHFVRTSI